MRPQLRERDNNSWKSECLIGSSFGVVALEGSPRDPSARIGEYSDRLPQVVDEISLVFVGSVLGF